MSYVMDAENVILHVGFSNDITETEIVMMVFSPK